MFQNTHKRMVLAMGAMAAVAMMSVGCSANPAMVERNALIEPDAREALVVAGPGLGASDALGEQLFVTPQDDFRFASAPAVYEMAMAESTTSLYFDTVPFEDRSATTPRQVIVSGEEPNVGPEEATVIGEIKLFE